MITVRLPGYLDGDALKRIFAIAEAHPGGEEVVIEVGERRLRLGARVELSLAVIEAMLDASLDASFDD